MSGLLNIGVSGLRAQQAALNIVGQNITNASTPGYTRQRVDLAAEISGANSSVFAGAGVGVQGITRVVDEFVSEQIRTDTAMFSELSSFNENVRTIESSLFDSRFGIDAALNEFFSALQSAANQPADLGLREFVLSSAEAVVDRFATVNERMDLQTRDLADSLESSVLRTNELATLIVDLNDRIAGLQAGTGQGAANLLLDQREEALRELSSLVSVRTSETDDGRVNVFIGKGQPLVLGADQAELRVTGDGDIAVVPLGGSTAEIITESISGGEIGGVLRYREEILWPAQNELGRLGAAFSQAMNEQHTLGVDRRGRFGGDLFRNLNAPELVSQRVEYLEGDSEGFNINVGRINVYIEDPYASVASDYEVRFSETGDNTYTIRRRSDNQVVFTGTNLETPQEVELDGLRIEFAAGNFRPGDSFVIRPYADIGSQMGVVITDPDQLALGSPVRITADPDNQGNLEIARSTVLDPGHPIFADLAAQNGNQLLPPVMVQFVTPTEYVLLDATDPQRPVPLDPDLGVQKYSSGTDISLFPGGSGTTLVTSSGPAAAALPANTSLLNQITSGTNGYPEGEITINYSGSQYSDAPTTLEFQPNTQASQIASSLSALPGVYASATNSLVLSDLVNHEQGNPVEIAINGRVFTEFADLDELADAITEDGVLSSAGITAVSDGTQLTLNARYGDDLTIQFGGDPNESVNLTTSRGEQTVLNGSVAGSYKSITVGGQLAVQLEDSIAMTTQYSGVFAANPEQQPLDFGFELVLNGGAEPNDEFIVTFNENGIGDNRNALELANLSTVGLVGDPARTFSESFGAVVQTVGVQASQASINESAARVLLDQSTAFRESVSGVNLDEEAAALIAHEQAYNASAQVISVARDLFNILINSVS